MPTPLSGVRMSPRSRGALARAGYQSAEAALAAGEAALLELDYVTPNTLRRLRESVQGVAAEPGAGFPSAGPPAPPPAGRNGNGRFKAALYPAAAALFPALLTAANGNSPYAAGAALDAAEAMGADEALVAERAFRLLDSQIASGRLPDEDDAREMVRLVRAQAIELEHPSPSPFPTNTTPGDGQPIV